MVLYSNDGVYLRSYDILQDILDTTDTITGQIQVDYSGNIYVLGYNGVLKYSSDFSQHSYIPFVNSPVHDVYSGDFAVNRQGDFYLADPASGMVRMYDNQGMFIKEFGGLGEQDEKFTTLNTIAVDRPGNVYVSDIKYDGVLTSTIKKFSADGEYLLKFGSGDPMSPMYMSGIGALAINNDYEVYAIDQTTTEVKRYEIEKNDSSIISADGRRVIDNLAISKQPVFTGATEPYAKVTVTVRSDPVTCEAIADAEGNWSCTLPTELPAGQHSMQAIINLVDESTLELGPFPLRVIGSLGTPGTTLGEGLLAPNTGLISRFPIIDLVLGTTCAVALALIGFVSYRFIKNRM